MENDIGLVEVRVLLGTDNDAALVDPDVVGLQSAVVLGVPDQDRVDFEVVEDRRVDIQDELPLVGDGQVVSCSGVDSSPVADVAPVSEEVFSGFFFGFKGTVKSAPDAVHIDPLSDLLVATTHAHEHEGVDVVVEVVSVIASSWIRDLPEIRDVWELELFLIPLSDFKKLAVVGVVEPKHNTIV